MQKLEAAEKVVINGPNPKSFVNLGAIRVLHVDDDPVILDVSKQILTMDSDLEIDHALSVNEALKKLKTEKYDLVISDFEMPEKDGLKFLKELREQNNDIPFILFTGKGREEVAVKALNLGVDGYYNKQGDPETVYGELSHGITKAVEFRRARMHAESSSEEWCKTLEAIKTARMETERSLNESEERYRSLFEQTPIPVAITAFDGTLIEGNNAIMSLTGYSVDESKGLNAVYLYENPRDRQRMIEKVMFDGSVTDFSTRIRCKDGSVIDVLMNVSVIHTKGESFLLTTAQDVTERKRSDEEAKRVEYALMESESKYRMLVELAQEGVWAIGSNNNTVYVNPRIVEMLGYEERELLGKDFIEFLVEEDAALALKNLESCSLGNRNQCEFVFVRKDGNRIYTNVAASQIKDDNGERIGTLALVSDITERKKAEEKLKESYERMEVMAEKLRVVGGLTRHDARNKLSAVTGYAYLIKKRHPDQPEIVEGLTIIEQSIKEVGRIFDFAKMYEQLGVEELTYLEVEKAINEAEALFSGLKLKVSNGCQGLVLLADSFLRQMFYNFIDNTRKYGEKATTAKMSFQKNEDGSLRLTYEDDGVGIAFENKPKLFREGFSTGGSTGFGLFLTKKMMDIYGWQIQENGELGKGARFVITIPPTNRKGQMNYQIH